MIDLRAIHIELPPWVDEVLAAWPRILANDEAAMGLAVALARENVRRGSGGPFGALVLESAGRALLAVGVNQVLGSRCSLAHAELVAIGLVQQAMGSHDLGELVPGGCTLVSSAEPCAMCLGAIPWAGIRRVVCGARDEDARAAGFDEGDKPADWVGAYQRRGIAITRDCLRGEARAVLLEYAAAGGPIYGPHAA
jgi:tRNA(Arg) A34 adenosine deaminase TadA